MPSCVVRTPLPSSPKGPKVDGYLHFVRLTPISGSDTRASCLRFSSGLARRFQRRPVKPSGVSNLCTPKRKKSEHHDAQRITKDEGKKAAEVVLGSCRYNLQVLPLQQKVSKGHPPYQRIKPFFMHTWRQDNPEISLAQGLCETLEQ